MSDFKWLGCISQVSCIFYRRTVLSRCSASQDVRDWSSDTLVPEGGDGQEEDKDSEHGSSPPKDTALSPEWSTLRRKREDSVSDLGQTRAWCGSLASAKLASAQGIHGNRLWSRMFFWEQGWELRGCQVCVYVKACCVWCDLSVTLHINLNNQVNTNLH